MYSFSICQAILQNYNLTKRFLSRLNNKMRGPTHSNKSTWHIHMVRYIPRLMFFFYFSHLEFDYSSKGSRGKLVSCVRTRFIPSYSAQSLSTPEFIAFRGRIDGSSSLWNRLERQLSKRWLSACFTITKKSMNIRGTDIRFGETIGFTFVRRKNKWLSFKLQVWISGLNDSHFSCLIPSNFNGKIFFS